MIFKGWQAKHISTKEVLSACDRFHGNKDSRAPYQIIIDETNAPEKVVYAAMNREEKRGNLEYGVSLRTAWLTEKGKLELTQ